MRVAVVAEETSHHRDTAATARLRRHVDLLEERGHEVIVFCRKWWEGSPTEWDDEDGVTYRALVGPSEESLPGWTLHTLPRTVRAFGPDVIHAAHANPFVVHGAKLASLIARAPLVVDWYETEASVGLHEAARRLAARIPDLIVAPSRLVKTGIRELGSSGDRVAVIPNGIDMAAIRETEPDAVADIVYSHPLDEDANLESLLLALAELRDLGWEVAVIGDGTERSRYEQQARDLRIDDRVRFVGEQPVDRRLALFKGAHVYAQTAERTPFATDLLRALACGCVGIVEYHRESSAHELVEHRDRGIRTTSEKELSDAIRSAGELPRMSVDESFAEFDEARILDRYLDCYRRIGAR